MIERNGTKYINEPHAGGGNPVLAIDESSEDAIFNDILGTSLGVVKNGGYSAIDKTSFGADSTDKSSFFTGKPYVEDLGYAFLFRNYRADLGKWLSQDLIGYPDGWNNLAYCGNKVTIAFDLYGAWATGDDYSIKDPQIPWESTPTQDIFLAEKAYEYFLLRNAHLSASLVLYIMTSTVVQNENGYNLDSRFSDEIISGFRIRGSNSFI